MFVVSGRKFNKEPPEKSTYVIQREGTLFSFGGGELAKDLLKYIVVIFGCVFGGFCRVFALEFWEVVGTYK